MVLPPLSMPQQSTEYPFLLRFVGFFLQEMSKFPKQIKMVWLPVRARLWGLMFLFCIFHVMKDFVILRDSF